MNNRRLIAKAIIICIFSSASQAMEQRKHASGMDFGQREYNKRMRFTPQQTNSTSMPQPTQQENQSIEQILPNPFSILPATVSAPRLLSPLTSPIPNTSPSPLSSNVSTPSLEETKESKVNKKNHHANKLLFMNQTNLKTNMEQRKRRTSRNQMAPMLVNQ